MAALRSFCLALIVVQNSSLILVTSYSRTLSPAYLPSVAVFLAEVIKAALALLFLSWELRSPAVALRQTTSLLREHGRETMQFGVPALCYTLQNHLWYYALSHLNPVAAALTSQMKVITTAIASVLMLSRRLTRMQWASICVLAAGMVVIQARSCHRLARQPGGGVGELHDSAPSPAAAARVWQSNDWNDAPPPPSLERHENSLGGAGAMLLSTILSAYAGVFLERLFKTIKLSLWMQSLQLSLFALPIAASCVAVYDFPAMRAGELMVGFNRWAWSAVLLNAIGGVAVSMALKYADNIQKTFAVGVSIVLNCTISALFLDIAMTWKTVTGVVLVVGATFLFSLQSAQRPSWTSESDEQSTIEESEPVLAYPDGKGSVGFSEHDMTECMNGAITTTRSGTQLGIPILRVPPLHLVPYCDGLLLRYHCTAALLPFPPAATTPSSHPSSSPPRRSHQACACVLIMEGVLADIAHRILHASQLEMGVFTASALSIVCLNLVCLPRRVFLRVFRPLGVGGARGKGARWQGLLEEDGGGESGAVPEVVRLQVHLQAGGEQGAQDFEVVDLETHGLRTIGDVKEAVAESYAETTGMSEPELAARMLVQCMDEESMLLVALPARTPLHQLSRVTRLIVSLRGDANVQLLASGTGAAVESLGSLAERKARLMLRGASTGGEKNDLVTRSGLPKQIKRSIEANRSKSSQSEFERRMERCRQQAEGLCDAKAPAARPSGAAIVCGCRSGAPDLLHGGCSCWKGARPQDACDAHLMQERRKRVEQQFAAHHCPAPLPPPPHSLEPGFSAVSRERIPSVRERLNAQTACLPIPPPPAPPPPVLPPPPLTNSEPPPIPPPPAATAPSSVPAPSSGGGPAAFLESAEFAAKLERRKLVVEEEQKRISLAASNENLLQASDSSDMSYLEELAQKIAMRQQK
ncbi:hypothetical protein AB1Y20_002285 [Prymnesium parvum]|uniref:Uncharacterized protein n=1 Tax=Prymnesium parvum TaxID=97485 RepID=A0AB34J8H7_PRYPA